MSRPLIGVSPWYDYDRKVLYIKDGYCEGIEAAGGLPVLLPATEDEEVMADIMDRCDGFLISGGPDVDAQIYGEYNLEFNEDISPIRDIIEINIIKKAIETNKPIFAICRGIQILNVALGGTLFQDINSQLERNHKIKHSQTAPKWYASHDIFIEKNTRLRQMFPFEAIKVNTYHHQAIKDIAKDLIVTAKSPDGVIEAVEHKSQRFVVGIQWHPELMWQNDAKFLKLFEEFVKEAGIK